MPSSLLPATTIEPARHDALERFRDPRLVLAAMPSGEHQCAVKACPFDARRHLEAGVGQRPEMWPKALHEMQLGTKSFRQAETGLRAKEQKTACLGASRSAGFEGMEKSGLRFRLHRCSVLLVTEFGALRKRNVPVPSSFLCRWHENGGRYAEKQTIIDLEKKFWETMVSKDADAATDMMAKTSIVTGPQGVSQVSRGDFGKMMEDGKWTLDSYKFSDIQRDLPRTSSTAVIGYKVKQKGTMDWQAL